MHIKKKKAIISFFLQTTGKHLFLFFAIFCKFFQVFQGTDIKKILDHTTRNLHADLTPRSPVLKSLSGTSKAPYPRP